MPLNPEQIRKRKTGITASEIPTICGLNPWRSPISVYEDKIAPVPDIIPEEELTEDQERGIELEDALLKWTGKRTDTYIFHNTGPGAQTFRCKTSEIMLATPDGIVYPEKGDGVKAIAVAEVKSPGPRTIHNWEDPVKMPDGIPEYYLPQVMWQMGTLDLSAAYIGALVGGKLWVYNIRFNEDLLFDLLEIAEDFWQRVKERRPPDVDATADYSKYLTRQYSRHKGPMIDASPQAEAAGLKLREIKADIKRLEAEARLQENLLKAEIGDSMGVKGSFGRITWKKNNDRTVVDMGRVKAYFEDDPTTLDRLSVTREGPRVFRTNFKEEV